MQFYFWRIAVLLTSSVCFGQTLAIGVIGGARVTDDLTGGGATSVSKRYVVGPALDIGLPLGFGVEVDALYRREGFQSFFGNPVNSGFSVEHANSWEFPMLLKYRLPFPLIQPFVEAGYAPRVMNGTISTLNTSASPPVQLQASSELWPTSQGLVIGGGVQFAIGRLRVSPGVRYAYWNNAAIMATNGNGPSWYSSQNQVDILVGIGWKIR